MCLQISRPATASMAAAQETAISPDTEATGHIQHLTATLQEATAHLAIIQAAVLQVLHAPTQAAQAVLAAQVQDHQVEVAAVHAAVAVSATEAEEDKFEIKRLRKSFYPQSSSCTIVHCKL